MAATKKTYKEEFDAPHIWNNEEDMAKHKINRENQEKIIRGDDTTYGLECWKMQKHDDKRILTAEMNWLWQIAGISRLPK